jgi:heptose I phosphotransferase
LQPLVRMIGLDAGAVFDHPDIRVWRSIADRENCTLDADVDGRHVRWHVKRYTAVRAPGATPAEREVAGIRLLQDAGIPTVPLVAWGVLADRRSFVIVDELAGYRPGDKLLEAGGATFDQLLGPTADLAAKLHASGLHHRDLYLCHFFIPQPPDDGPPLRLIDCARVKRLPRFLTRYRWVVKDLAQFWYSTLKHPEITDEQRLEWLRRYAERAGGPDAERLRRSVARKVAWIGRHDARLNRAQPNRNISIPK